MFLFIQPQNKNLITRIQNSDDDQNSAHRTITYSALGTNLLKSYY